MRRGAGAYPDFLGIGAQKAGTTWLYRNLEAHPEIWMPPRKEIHYFDARNRQGRGLLYGLFGRSDEDRNWRGRIFGSVKAHALDKPSLENLLWDLRYHTGGLDDEWYASLFEPGKGKVAGDITPSYSVLDHDAVARVYDLMPEAKVIFLMRNPIERIWSQIVMSFDRTEQGSAGSIAKGRLIRRSERESLRKLTDYLQTLKTWNYFYPEDRIFVGFLEDVSLFPGELLERLYGFLEVDSSYRPPDLEKKVHTRSVGRIPVRIAARLAEDYRGEIADLSERLGGYTDFWLYCAGRLAEDPPPGVHVPYPFIESSLWPDWVNSAGEPRGARSGTLDRLQAG